MEQATKALVGTATLREVKGQELTFETEARGLGCMCSMCEVGQFCLRLDRSLVNNLQCFTAVAVSGRDALFRLANALAQLQSK